MFQQAKRVSASFPAQAPMLSRNSCRSKCSGSWIRRILHAVGFYSVFEGWVWAVRGCGGGCGGVCALSDNLVMNVECRFRWLATEQTKFVNGRYMRVNWDVCQLFESEVKSTINSTRMLMLRSDTRSRYIIAAIISMALHSTEIPAPARYIRRIFIL